MKDRVITRWRTMHEKEHAHYAHFVGFETDIRKRENLSLAYDEMDIYTQIDLFGFVIDLLSEENFILSGDDDGAGDQ